MSENCLVPFIKIKEERDVSESCDQQVSDYGKGVAQIHK
jgi:hypothetical protein